MCCYLGLHILAQFLRDTSHQLDEAEDDEKKMRKSGKLAAGNILSGLASKVKNFAVKTATPFFQELLAPVKSCLVVLLEQQAIIQITIANLHKEPSDEQYMLQWCFHSSSIAFESEASATARKRKA
eukprot:s6516_g6.t1